MSRRGDVEAALIALESGKAAKDLETTRIEFKEDNVRSIGDTLKELAHAAICFANTDGGVVIQGVSDKLVGVAAFVGTTLDIEEVRRRVYDLTQPHIIVNVEEEPRQGKRLLVVDVPRSPDIHADTQGRATRRIGTACVPIGPVEQGRLREERMGFDPSAGPSDRTLGDVTDAALGAVRSRLQRFTDDRRSLATLSRRDLVKALGVMDANDRLSKAGDILLCPPPAHRPLTMVYQYRDTPGGEPKLVERLDSPLVVAVERLLALVEARRNVRPVTLASGQQINVADFPELAVREAVANALIHRDYHVAEPVTIEHSPNVLVVSSPGPLVAGVTPENILTHPSKPRNAALAKACRILGLAEEIGRGVDRMFREMILSGKALPTIEDQLDHVRVSLVGGAPNTQIARFMAQLPEREREDTDTLLVLFRLCTTQTVTATLLEPVLQKTADEINQTLRRLASDEVGILEPTRLTARRAYATYRLRADAIRALGSALPYQKRTIDEIDRKVIAHVNEYGKVSSKTIRNLFDVDIPRARDILADLVNRHILVKTSVQQRGPNVQYGRGPKFPGAQQKKKRPPRGPKPS